MLKIGAVNRCLSREIGNLRIDNENHIIFKLKSFKNFKKSWSLSVGRGEETLEFTQEDPSISLSVNDKIMISFKVGELETMYHYEILETDADTYKDLCSRKSAELPKSRVSRVSLCPAEPQASSVLQHPSAGPSEKCLQVEIEAFFCSMPLNLPSFFRLILCTTRSLISMDEEIPLS